MVNGDAESRAQWVTYASGMIATSIFGTKGAGTVTKAGTTATKTGVANASKRVSKLDMSNLFPFGPQYQVATGGYVPFNVVDGKQLKDQLIWQAEKLHGKGTANHRTRLPRNNGHWKGEPGNGKWYSDKLEVKNITNGEGVEFTNGRPNFTPWSKGSIKFKKDMLDGSKNDFNLVYEKIMQLKGFKSMNQAKVWLKEKGLTPHHKSTTDIELIPIDLHGNIPHIGSASDLRGGK